MTVVLSVTLFFDSHFFSLQAWGFSPALFLLFPAICCWPVGSLSPCLLRLFPSSTFPGLSFTAPVPEPWQQPHFLSGHPTSFPPALKWITSLELSKELLKAPGSPLSLSSLSGGQSQITSSESWGGGQKSLVFRPPEQGPFRAVGRERALRRACSGLSLSARFRGFFFLFYCPCQLAAQGDCQLSVGALIFVSYGQVLSVLCYLFRFVQPELYLSTN